MDARTATDQLVRVLEGSGPAALATHDRGGLTKWGITDKEYQTWRLAHGMPARTVDFMTPDEMYSIYLSDYWLPAGGGRLPDGLDYVVFQAGVNCGVGTAVMMLQRLVGTKADGLLGPVTLAAVKQYDKAQLIKDYLGAQEVHYSNIVAEDPSQQSNLKGWYNRILKVQNFLASYKQVAGISIFLILAAVIAVKNLSK